MRIKLKWNTRSTSLFEDFSLFILDVLFQLQINENGHFQEKLK